MLKEEARRQGKPFGLLFENIEGGFTFTGRSTPNAFNVLPNSSTASTPTAGRAELVRGVDLIGTPLAAFGKILAASDAIDVFNGMCGAESGSVPVSASSPSLLVSEVEVQKKAQSQETLPILPAPDRRGGEDAPDMRVRRRRPSPLVRASLAALRVRARRSAPARRTRRSWRRCRTSSRAR